MTEEKKMEKTASIQTAGSCREESTKRNWPAKISESSNVAVCLRDFAGQIVRGR